MQLLQRYLLKQFFTFFFTVGAGFVSLYLLIDFFEKIDNFTEAGVPIKIALSYFLFSIPGVVDQLGPILILLSGVITLGLLNHSNELTALKAGGLPLAKIIRPIIGGGVIVTLLFIASAQWLLPHSKAVTNTIWVKGVQKKSAEGTVRNGYYFYQGKRGIYTFTWRKAGSNQLTNFSYSEPTPNYRLRSMLSAEQARWQPEKKSWLLQNGSEQLLTADGNFTVRQFTNYEVTLPEGPSAFRTPAHFEDELSLSQLYSRSSENSVNQYIQNRSWLRFLGKISYILLGLPLLLLGLPILLSSYQRWGRDLSVAIPASCALAFSAWAIWGALQSFALSGQFPPWIAAFAIHILFSALGIFLLRRFDQ